MKLSMTDILGIACGVELGVIAFILWLLRTVQNQSEYWFKQYQELEVKIWKSSAMRVEWDDK